MLIEEETNQAGLTGHCLGNTMGSNALHWRHIRSPEQEIKQLELQLFPQRSALVAVCMCACALGCLSTLCMCVCVCVRLHVCVCVSLRVYVDPNADAAHAGVTVGAHVG